MAIDAQPIVNLTQGNVICERVTVADRLLPRLRGLLGRDSLPGGEGVLLRPAPSVHTAFMRFPIDVVFLDREMQVVKVVEDMRPWRTASARRAKSTLELASGEAAARKIRIGDRLAVVTAVEQSNTRDGASSNGNSTSRTSVQTTQPLDAGNENPPTNGAHPAERTYVLLVGRDRRFRSVTATLLARHGCTVMLSKSVANVAGLAQHAGADVVVIDAGSSITAAAREAGRIQALDPPVGVVLIRDEPAEGPAAMPVLAKWSSFDELCGAIAQARPNRSGRSGDGQHQD
jgi:uncharacterized protein